MKLDRVDNQDLISIIIPVYNVEKYLARCIESIINQTYRSIEVILINDGSTDSSLKICEEYAKNDTRIKIINQNNKGPAYSRNIGVQESKGKFISFVDSDDFLDLNYYYDLYNLLLKTNSDFVQCNYMIVDENEENLDSSIQPIPIDKYYSGSDYLQLLYEDEIRPMNILLWNKLYKRELWNNIKAPIGNLHDDDYVLPYIINKSSRITITSKILYFYRVRVQSIMNIPDAKYLIKKNFDYNWVQSDRYNFFKTNGYSILASRSIEEKANCIRNIYKITKSLNNKELKREYLKKLQEDVRTYFKQYLFNKNIKNHIKIKFIRYYLGFF